MRRSPDGRRSSVAHNTPARFSLGPRIRRGSPPGKVPLVPLDSEAPIDKVKVTRPPVNGSFGSPNSPSGPIDGKRSDCLHA